jgi:hypothetical protein
VPNRASENARTLSAGDSRRGIATAVADRLRGPQEAPRVGLVTLRSSVVERQAGTVHQSFAVSKQAIADVIRRERPK